MAAPGLGRDETGSLHQLSPRPRVFQFVVILNFDLQIVNGSNNFASSFGYYPLLSLRVSINLPSALFGQEVQVLRFFLIQRIESLTLI